MKYNEKKLSKGPKKYLLALNYWELIFIFDFTIQFRYQEKNKKRSI